LGAQVSEQCFANASIAPLAPHVQMMNEPVGLPDGNEPERIVVAADGNEQGLARGVARKIRALSRSGRQPCRFGAALQIDRFQGFAVLLCERPHWEQVRH